MAQVSSTVTLLALNDDNTTGSFWLCRLFYVLSMVYVYAYICKGVHIYYYGITDGTTTIMCHCALLAAIGVVCYLLTVHYLWWVYADTI